MGAERAGAEWVRLEIARAQESPDRDVDQPTEREPVVLDLSHRRARAVVEYLRARGVDPERLDYVGLGATKPLGPNDSPEGRALNRRVEFRIE